jgi:uncharacterized protein involved in exopolysaccharide biosynthesis
MELQDYINIFKKQTKVFFVVVLVVVLAAIIWQKSQPINYQATLLLNIGRQGVQDTTQYKYDGFYRLQADERFADTVVRWMASPRVVEDIYAGAGLDPKNLGVRDLKNIFAAKRLSSQMVEVTFVDPDTKTLKKISEAAVEVLNRYTQSLNKENAESSWFVIIGSEPVIRNARVSLNFALALALPLGIFFGFWAALLAYYLKRDEGCLSASGGRDT